MEFDLIFLFFVGMALFKPLLGNLSGKIAGNVFSRNKAGQYVRNWAKPTSTPSPAQTVMRALFGAAATFWRSLTPAQVQSWNDWALTQTRLNRQGESYIPTGRQLSAELNSVISALGRFVTGLTNITDPPTSAVEPANVSGAVVTAEQTTGVLTSLSIEIPGIADSMGANDICVFEAAPIQPAQKYHVKNLFRAIEGIASGGFTLDTVELIMKFEEEFDTTIADPTNAFAWIRYYIADKVTGLRSPAITVYGTVQSP